MDQATASINGRIASLPVNGAPGLAEEIMYGLQKANSSSAHGHNIVSNTNHMPSTWQSRHPGAMVNGIMTALRPGTPVGIASAAANLSSLSNSNSSTVLDRVPSNQQLMYAGIMNSAFTPSASVMQNKQNFIGNTNQQNDTRIQNTLQNGNVAILQRELEQERLLRTQLQQKLVDLNQRMHCQPLIEKSYEDLVVKYKHVVAQMQQMNLVIERYKNVIKQLEQEKRLLVSENVSLKAQETVAHDKSMLYNILMERSKKLEEENSSLVLENETYQRQYEKSLDEISKQVVQALLTQKTLQEQCLQLQERLNDLEKENMEYGEVIRQNKQVSSDTRLVWSYKGRTRAQTSSPSADSVRSMPAQHLYWKHGSIGSLEYQAMSVNAEGFNGKGLSEQKKGSTEIAGAQAKDQYVCVETEFPANNGSPKSTRRNLDRHPSSGSLDSAYHSRGFVKINGQDVRCQRSISAEALRDMKINIPHNPQLLSNALISHELLSDINKQYQYPEGQKDPSTSVAAEKSCTNTDSGIVNDPFADDADDILSKHQSLIVGSMEDIFSTFNGGLNNDVIHEEDVSTDVSGKSMDATNLPPTPPPRPHSRCLSECSFVTDSKSSQYEQSAVSANYTEPAEFEPPPLPPKQYTGSRRPYKPLPAEPVELISSLDEDNYDQDSNGKNTDSESIKQEITSLTKKLVKMSTSVNNK